MSDIVDTNHSSPVTAQGLRNMVKFLKVDGTWRCDNDSINAVLDQFLAEIERLHGPAQCGLNPEALAALKNYTQADDDGVMVNVSRQALDEAIAALTSTQAPAQRTSITQFTDAELRNELHRRAQDFLGDPSKGVSVTSTDGGRTTVWPTGTGNTPQDVQLTSLVTRPDGKSVPDGN